MSARRRKSKKLFDTSGDKPPEQATFFVEICLGKTVGQRLREANWRVEYHTDHFAADEDDEVWLPAVAQRGWVILTKDKAIRRKPWELQKVISANAKMFTLTSGQQTGEEMAQVFKNNIARIDALIQQAGNRPFAAAVHKHDVVEIQISQPRLPAGRRRKRK